MRDFRRLAVLTTACLALAACNGAKDTATPTIDAEPSVSDEQVVDQAVPQDAEASVPPSANDVASAGNIQSIFELSGGSQTRDAITTKSGDLVFVHRLRDGIEEVLTVDPITAEILAASGDLLDNRDGDIEAIATDATGDSVFVLIATGERSRKLINVDTASGEQTDTAILRDNYSDLVWMDGYLYTLSENFLGKPRKSPLRLARLDASNLNKVEEMKLGDDNTEYAILPCQAAAKLAIPGSTGRGAETKDVVSTINSQPFQVFEMITIEAGSYGIVAADPSCSTAAMTVWKALSLHSLSTGETLAVLDLDDPMSSSDISTGVWEDAAFSPVDDIVFGLLASDSDFSLVLLRSSDLVPVGTIPVPSSVVSPSSHDLEGNVFVSGDGNLVIAVFDAQEDESVDKVLTFRIDRSVL